MQDFEVIVADSACQARRGVLHTGHGEVQTPVFMPVGTRGAVKGITPAQLRETGTTVVLANTYHLLLRPGIEVVCNLGGLHEFAAWPGPILTDSGGYQVFSLSTLNRVSDDGVEFVSHIDGERLFINAQIATKAQNRLGADVIMCFDQCPAFGCESERLTKAVDRTIRWASSCRETHSNPRQLLFAIVQGGVDFELRARCASELAKLDFDGYAIGGLSVGEGHEDMVRTVSYTAKLLPAHRPRYLMGVGTAGDIIAAVQAGMDMFDCVLPTRNARNAVAFTENGALRLRNAIHTNDSQPVEPDCDCYCCRNFTRAALRHFFNIGEMLGPILLSIHNLRFYQRLMEKIRYALEQGRFCDWAQQQLRKYRTIEQ